MLENSPNLLNFLQGVLWNTDFIGKQYQVISIPKLLIYHFWNFNVFKIQQLRQNRNVKMSAKSIIDVLSLATRKYV